MYGDFLLHAVYLKHDFTEYVTGFQTTKVVMQFYRSINRQVETTRIFRKLRSTCGDFHLHAVEENRVKQFSYETVLF